MPPEEVPVKLALLLILLPVLALGQAQTPEQRIAALEAKVAEQAKEIAELKVRLDAMDARPVTVVNQRGTTAERATENAPTAEPTRVSAEALAANCISCAAATYPDLGKAVISDTVILAVVIGKDGTVKDARVVRGHALLQENALMAVRSWRYKPFSIGGNTAEVSSTVWVPFVFK